MGSPFPTFPLVLFLFSASRALFPLSYPLSFPKFPFPILSFPFFLFSASRALLSPFLSFPFLFPSIPFLFSCSVLHGLSFPSPVLCFTGSPFLTPCFPSLLVLFLFSASRALSPFLSPFLSFPLSYPFLPLSFPFSFFSCSLLPGLSFPPWESVPFLSFPLFPFLLVLFLFCASRALLFLFPSP